LKRFVLVFVLGATLALSAGAARAQQDANDPLEPMNRVFFSFDMFLDRILVKPVTQVYVAVVPRPGRRAIHNVLQNMNEPIVFANDILQGQFHRADITLGRFLLNSIFGLAGIFDWATESGLPQQTGDFGQTLYVWGVPSGPYLVLPLLGPTNPRDAIGFGVDSYADPVGYAFWNAGGLRWLAVSRMGTDTVDQRSQNLGTLDELQKTAIDFYAEVRSLTRQHREYELRNGKPAPLSSFDSMYKETPPTESKPPAPATAKEPAPKPVAETPTKEPVKAAVKLPSSAPAKQPAPPPAKQPAPIQPVPSS
jgi:phospholipid-binding lipoprotein MlaA